MTGHYTMSPDSPSFAVPDDDTESQPPSLTDEQCDAAIKAWFETDIVAGRQPFAKRMRAAFAAAHGITKEKS